LLVKYDVKLDDSVYQGICVELVTVLGCALPSDSAIGVVGHMK